MSSALRVTVVGGGLMGHGIAQVFAVAGAQVTVYEPIAGARESVKARIAANLQSTGSDCDITDQVTVVGSLEPAVADADWVFEAAPERLELKRDLFRRIDAAAPAAAVLATNTSVMRVGEIAADAERRARIVGTHWWNPPYLIPLVEVVQSAETSDEVVSRTIELLRTVGKTPVHVRRDVPGFVGNRLQHAMWRQAFELVDAGVCDAETIDTVVKEGFGRRLGILGPMENADLIGLDLTLAIHEYVLPELDPPSEPSPGLRSHVQKGELGMRTGSGFRQWTEEEAETVRGRLRDFLVEAAR